MVIDASALAALIYLEAEAEDVRDRIVGATLTAPLLIDFEMASICITKQKRDPLQAGFYEECFSKFLRLPISRRDIEFGLVIAVAKRFRLSAYDASYLALALRTGHPLFTLDRRLATAAAASHA